MRSSLRRSGGSLLLGLAAATFFLAPPVEQLLRLSAAKLYFVRLGPDRMDYLILLGLILIGGLPAGLCDLAAHGTSGWKRRALEVPLRLLLAMAVEHLVHGHLSRYPPVWNAVARAWNQVGITAVDGWFILGGACGLAAAAACWLWPKIWYSGKPILGGAAAVLWLAIGFKITRPPEFQSALEPSSRIIPAHAIGPGQPIVWIILDEWDYDLTFRRTDGKVFPEFDRLRSQSVFLENVQAAGKVTLTAIPSLLMGRSVREYRAASVSGARFVSAGTSEAFPGPPTIFDAAAQFGYQSQIVGWYHPYCRIFGAQTTSCWWDDLMLPGLRPGRPAGERATALLRDAFELENMPGLGPANNIQRQLARVDPMIEKASLAASAGGRTFSFLHLPLPHGPFFSRDSLQRLIPLPNDPAHYDFGLTEADRALGLIRSAMERTGAWDEALVVVTTDHPYRYQLAGGYGNGHIPMMIKLPHQTAPATYRQSFQAVHTKSLIEDFIQGRATSPERAIAWLENRPSTPVSMTLH